MARIPLTAAEQLQLAHERGHDLTIDIRGEKFWVVCTCGYRSTSRRSRSAVNSTMAWHLGKVLSADRVNGL